MLFFCSLSRHTVDVNVVFSIFIFTDL